MTSNHITAFCKELAQTDSLAEPRHVLMRPGVQKYLRKNILIIPIHLDCGY